MENARTWGIIGVLWLFSLAGAVAARAGTITLSLGGADTGTITLTETGNDTLITEISGTFDGSTIGSLISPGGLGSNDNLFFTPAPYVDNAGVSFTLTTPDTDGFSDVNLYFVAPPNGPIYETGQSNSPVSFDGGQNDQPDTLTATSTAAPEPAAGEFMLVGFGVIWVMRRMRLAPGRG